MDELKKIIKKLDQLMQEVASLKKSQASPNPAEYETIEAAHKRSGVPKRTLYYYVAENKVPHYRVGRTLFLKLIPPEVTHDDTKSRRHL